MTPISLALWRLPIHLVYYLKFFYRDTIYITSAVEQELLNALTYGKSHIEDIFTKLKTGEIKVLQLTDEEQELSKKFPPKFHDGECECMALCQIRQYLFLSNDIQAIRYCKSYGIKALGFEALLRLMWTNAIRTQDEVKTMIQKMNDVENLVLSQNQLSIIFDPRSRRQRRKR